MPRLLFSFSLSSSLSVAALGLVSVFGSAACSTHTIITAAPEPTVTFEKTCAKTACEAERAATSSSSATSHCSECIDAIESSCLSGGSCDTSQCNFACDPPPSPSPPACTDTTTCVEYTWAAHISGFTPTPGFAEACVDAIVKLNARCLGASSTDADNADTEASCAKQALVLTNAAIPPSACLESFDCKTGNARCEQTSTVGDHFCAMREATCGSPCSDDERNGLNDLGFGLKPALIAATLTCANQSSCQDVDACMAAWLKLL